jgi:hypothetical protein
LFPSVLVPHLGGCGTRAFSAQTVLAACPSAAQAEGTAKGIKVKPDEYRRRLFNEQNSQTPSFPRRRESSPNKKSLRKQSTKP